MSGNFQNNYRGGWNHIPFIGFSPAPFNYNYQIPLYWGPINYNYHIPHQHPANYPNNRPLLHQVPPHYVDNRHLPHKMPTYYYDPRHLTHPMPVHYFNPRPLPLQMPGHNTDTRPLPRVYKRNLPHNEQEDSADKKNLPHKNPEDYNDKKCLSHQTSEHHGDKKGLPHQTPEDVADKRPLPHQKAEEDADSKCLPHQTSEHNADKMSLPQQSPDLSQRTPEDYVDKKCLQEPTIPAVATLQCVRCEICGVVFPLKNLEAHNNGERHRRMLLELREKSTKRKTSNGDESIHIQNSQMNPVVQTKKVSTSHKVPKRKKDRCPVENKSHEASRFEYKEVPAEGSKRKLRDHTDAKDHCSKVENVKIETPSFQKKKVPADKSKRKVRDNTDAKDHGSKRETGEATGGKYMKISNGVRRSVKSSKPKVNALVQIPELIPTSGRVASPKGKERHKFQNITVEKNDRLQSTPVELNASAGSNTSAETESISCDFSATVTPEVPVISEEFTPSSAVESNFEPKNHVDSQREVTEAKEHHKIPNCALERNDQPNSNSMELLAPGCCNINTVAEDNFSDSDATEIVPPQGSITSQVSTQSAAMGSSFEHLEVQSGVETNDQPHSISMEFHGPAGSDINAMIGDTCSNSGAIVLAPPQSPIAFQVSTPVAIIQTEMSESKVNNEVQNDIVDSNDQQHSISMELHDPAGSMTNNQTEIVNFDSAAIEIVIEPLASAQPNAAGTSFEPLTELGLHTETKPQVSEAVAYIECQQPTVETDIELLPSVFMEIDAASEVSVCLTCGDEGFKEAIVYCNKCGDYSMHRYCLDGPVIFTDEVIWFCEDCEEEILGADYTDSENADSEKYVVDSSKEYATFVGPQPIVDPIWRGALQVFNKSFDKTTRLMGHLSTLACPKVLEETRHLPNVLHGDLLQISAVWPESFRKFGTNNLSIGLYFFPQNERVERYFDQLVDEMISNDLAIRIWIEKAELLIFPSTLLTKQHKRFQSKYYLWGIFKRKQEPFKINDTSSGNDANY